MVLMVYDHPGNNSRDVIRAPVTIHIRFPETHRPEKDTPSEITHVVDADFGKDLLSRSVNNLAAVRQVHRQAPQFHLLKKMIQQPEKYPVDVTV